MYLLILIIMQSFQLFLLPYFFMQRTSIFVRKTQSRQILKQELMQINSEEEKPHRINSQQKCSQIIKSSNKILKKNKGTSRTLHQSSQPVILLQGKNSGENENNKRQQQLTLKKRQSRHSEFKVQKNNILPISVSVHTKSKVLNREQIRRDIKRRISKKRLQTIAKYRNFEENFHQVDYQSYRVWRQSHGKQKQNKKIKDSVSELRISLQDEQKRQNTSFSHTKIKQIFGNHHNLFKTDNDYLQYKKSASEYKCFQQFQKMKSQIKVKEASIQQNIEVKKIKKHVIKKINKNQLYEMGNCQLQKLYKPDQLKSPPARAPITPYLKCTNNKIHEINFCRNKYAKLQSQSLLSVYIDPIDNRELFEQVQSYNFFDGLSMTQISNQPNLQTEQELVFVKFLQTLYKVDSDRIVRNFQLPSESAYYVWLFLDGEFRKLEIDPYFYVNLQINFLYVGPNCSLWLLILIKCISLLYGSLQYRVLSKINPEQIYQILTGIQLLKITRDQLIQFSTQQFQKQINKKAQKRNICFILNQFTNENKNQYKFGLLTKRVDDKKQRILSLWLQGAHVSQITPEDRAKCTIYVIPSLFNMYVYSFAFFSHVINKLQIICKDDQQVLFSSSSISQKLKQKYIHIYEIIGFQPKSIQKSNIEPNKLKLRANKELKRNVMIKFKKGSYIIFISDLKHKVSQIFSKSKDQNSCFSKKNKFKISMMSTEQIRVDQCGIVYKNGAAIEDKENNYIDLTNFHKNQQY